MIYNLIYSIPKEVPIVFQNWYNYDYHFIIKDLAEEFKKQFTCLGENTGKNITFSVPTQKGVTRIKEMKNKLQKPYPTECNLLMAQD